MPLPLDDDGFGVAGGVLQRTSFASPPLPYRGMTMDGCGVVRDDVGIVPYAKDALDDDGHGVGGTMWASSPTRRMH